MSRDCKPVLENLMREVTGDCAAVFEKLVGNRDKEEQGDIYLGLKKIFWESPSQKVVKERQISHQTRSKATTDVVGLINQKTHCTGIKGH